MPKDDRITVRLGSLYGPLVDRCEKTGERTGQVVLEALAKELGQAVPEKRQGFAAMSKTKQQRARRASLKTRRNRVDTDP